MPNQTPTAVLRPTGATPLFGSQSSFATSARGNDLIALSTGTVVALV